MEYKVTIELREVYQGYVEATSIEEAEELAYEALDNEELNIILDTSDITVEPED